MGDLNFNSLPVAEQAAYWLRVLKDECTEERLAEFQAWKGASAKNAREFAFAQQVEHRIQRLNELGILDVDAWLGRANRQRSRQRRTRCAGIVASVALLALLLTYFASVHQAPQIYATTVQQQLFGLEDGSVVALNAQSEMRVAFSAEARDLYLKQGQGIFRVRHDARRPFRVHVGTAVVEAVGTQFDVRKAGDQEIVAVLEGVVELQRSSSAMKVTGDTSAHLEPKKVTAGQLVTLLQDGRIDEIKTVDVTAVTAWRRSEEKLELLKFKYRPLAEIVDAFNRHNAEPKFRVEGDELRARRFALTFDDASAESLRRSLAPHDDLEFVPDGRDIVIRRREPY